jgi:hypothetical protein
MVGVSRLTPNWSRFQYQPGSVFLQIAHLADLLGQITPMGQSAFERYEGAEAAQVLRKLQTWLGAGLKRGENTDWMVGRRLVAGWKPSEMVAFEGLQVPPSKFGLSDDANGSAVLYELWEFDGVLMEMYPKKLPHIPENAIPDIVGDSRNWLADEKPDDYGRLLASPAG